MDFPIGEVDNGDTLVLDFENEKPVCLNLIIHRIFFLGELKEHRVDTLSSARHSITP